MRKLLSLAAGLAVLTLMLTSCKTTNLEGRLLASTAQTVHAAMQGWAVWVVKGQATEDSEARVRAAYGRYQLAMDAALSCYTVWKQTGEKHYWTRAEITLRTNRETLLNLISSLRNQPPLNAPAVSPPAPPTP